MQRRTILKRTMSLLLTFVMMVSMIPSLAMTAAAATDSVKVYFKLPSGAAASDWGVNVWGTGVEVTKAGETTVRPTAWGEGDGYATMLTEEDSDGFGYVVISGTVAGLQFVSADKVVENCWNAEIAKQGLEAAYYDPKERVMVF